MIVEIRGTGVHNKGAELMLIAIKQQLLAANPNLRFAVSTSFGPFAVRAKYGLLAKVHPQNIGRSRIARLFMSRSFRESYGLVIDADIDVVLDASGFAFGDQWGNGPTDSLARESKAWNKLRTQAILLPQAFGPFSNDKLRSNFRRALESLSLVYARDRLSFENIQGLGGPFENVKLAPDFTQIIDGNCPEMLELPERFACIVPNIRMLDQTSPTHRDSYVRFLTECVRELDRHDIHPLLLYHDRKYDERVAEILQRDLSRALPAIALDDPVQLKGVLGRAIVVIGSRFHALVGALSQGVPSIGTSWSHKYEMLFEDYACPECLVSPATPREEIQALVSRLCDSESQVQLRNRLQERAGVLRHQVNTMFQDVIREIRIPA
jgi:polysaccharide pyruvyl transferase WcaK-like protein